MRILGLVTARGGSKGFPGKNLALLAGRPLVAWAHRTLAGLRRRHPGLILHLSTDDPAIAAAWPEADRPRVLRPAHLATDTATSLDVVLHALDQHPADAVLLLQPTSPLMDTDDLDRLLQAGLPSSICVAEADHPPHWAHRRDEAGRLHRLLDSNPQRRQDMPTAWMPVGAYLADTAWLRQHRSLLVPGVTIGVPVPRSHAVDIDHADDLVRAEALAQPPERPFAIGPRRIGGGAPCCIIAEAGVNHDGDPEAALALVRAAAAAGADAVKFQAFRTDALVTAGARKAAYQAANDGAGSQADMLRRLELDAPTLARLAAEAQRLGIVFLCSPFDWDSACMLHQLQVPAFKLGSGELTNLPLLGRIAGLGRPLIISTGMSTLDECEAAAATIRAAGNPPTAWLHCVSCYPAPEAQSNLRALDSLRTALGGPVGMSDHSPGTAISVAAVARGAQLLEKHLTLSRNRPGPDHAASVEPPELTELVRQVRLVEAALGDGIKRPMPCERDTAAVARRALVAARDLPAGTVLTEADLIAKRPADGLAPGELPHLLGRRLRQPLARDQAIAWEHL